MLLSTTLQLGPAYVLTLVPVTSPLTVSVTLASFNFLFFSSLIASSIRFASSVSINSVGFISSNFDQSVLSCSGSGSGSLFDDVPSLTSGSFSSSFVGFVLLGDPPCE